MPDNIRFDHDIMTDTGLHVITSPDIQGFCVVGDTHEAAETEALQVLEAIRRNELGPFSRQEHKVEARAASA